ncbi:MAG: AAA family ATPase [Candidatus Diapherotrites archaeon]|nr:AAA family ATPase [Candidatus Diapherotrites archaeon]
MVERIPTGVPGFDKLIENGLPKGSITLISGTPGTGKSILCSQIAFNNALKGKKVLYLNLEQNEGRLEAQMLQFAWDPEKVKNNLKIVSVDSSDSQIVEYILSEIKKLNYDLIILDSLDSISSTQFPSDKTDSLGMQKIAESVIPTIFDAPTIGRLKLKKIFTAIAKSKATALLTSERVENGVGLSRDTISEFLCDGIITLTYSSVAGGANRTFEIRKMRLTDFSQGIMPMELNSKGISVTSLEEEKL